MTAAPILFAGDPHRNFAPILRACAASPRGTLVIVGDCDCPAPLDRIMAPVLAAGWRVLWILGNHDTETEAAYDHLTGCAGDIGVTAVDAGGIRLAGLPGVFKPRVWSPRAETPGGPIEPPQCLTRTDFLAELPADRHWRGGLPLWHRDTIFPEDFDRLRRERFDVLVTHEAPSSHRHGFPVIDELAAACGVSWIVHGHHHESYQATLPNGVQVRGLGLGEIWRLPPDTCRDRSAGCKQGEAPSASAAHARPARKGRSPNSDDAPAGLKSSATMEDV